MLAHLLEVREIEIRNFRKNESIHPVFKRIDTCAAEFESSTAYMYSTYSDFVSLIQRTMKVMILGRTK